MSKARDLANAGTALTTVSATELGYLDGVTSAVQTQIDSKIGQSTAINPTIVDAKGDIIAASAADTVARLAVGTNGQVLTAASGEATGLQWATPSAGGMTLIQRTVPSALGSLSFSSIPSTYTDLYIRWVGLYTSAANTNMDFRFNNDSGSNYWTAYFYESGVATSPADRVFSSRFLNGNTSTTDFPARGWLKISNYASATYKKQFDAFSAFKDASPANKLYSGSGYWNSTSAITSVDIFLFSGAGTFSAVSGGFIELWGVK